MTRVSARYRVTLCDRRGREIGRLPPIGGSALQYASVLNGGGSASLSPSMTLPLISGDRRRNLRAWASELVIERLDGYGDIGVVWAGPVAPPKGDLDSNALSVSAQPLWSWLAERDIDRSHLYPATEQVDVARDLIRSYTTDLGDAGDIRLDLGELTTGVKVTEQYLPGDSKNVGQAVTDLATADNGFDFDIEYDRDPVTGRVIRRWQPYYPQKGRTISRTLRKGRGGLRAFSIEDATQIVTRVRGSGQLTLKAQAPPEVEAEFGIHSKAISLTDSTSQSLLKRQVAEYLKNRTPPVDIVSFQYRVTKATPYGMIRNGDTVPIDVDHGWVSYHDSVRVIGTSVTVDGNGGEVVACTAAGVPGGLT